ncbi:unnamed protein product [Chilo suppressalis]|uniref:Peptidase S1 domain-containing protein n=1 Tax=Chilo suppressalis TaxID=168631 RepID=A0ABN8BCY1_CHISP|nr:unnamed protein product [Chilo suppressalis]
MRWYAHQSSTCIDSGTLCLWTRTQARTYFFSLGEHDVRNTTDSIDGVCSAPPQTVEVLNVHPHPGYINERFIKRNDIALIRLARRVEYTDYVQPICLNKSGLWEIGDEVFVAGWGKALGGGSSPEKLKVSLPIANQSECSQRFDLLLKST